MMHDPMRQAWHLAALTQDVKERPLRRVIAGTPVVLFRTDAGLAGLLDRCPHRNYPLSQGRVENGRIVCPYHGWAFGRNGRCEIVAGCDLETDRSERLSAAPVALREEHGAIFVRLEGDEPFPDLLHPYGDPDFDHFWWDQGDWRTTVFDAVENVMDPFHTAELHHGHIRRRDRRIPVRITVENFERGVEMTIDQDRPDHGFMAKLFERSRSSSRSRFDAPTRFHGVWEGEKGINISVLVFFTPTMPGHIRPIARFMTPRGLVPSAIKARIIKAFIAPVVRQDRRALETQADTVATFGSPRYVQGPGDPLGGRVRQLMDGVRLPPGITDSFEAHL